MEKKVQLVMCYMALPMFDLNWKWTCCDRAMRELIDSGEYDNLPRIQDYLSA